MMDFKNNKSKIIVPLALVLGVFVGAVFVLQTQGTGAQLLKEGKKMFIPVASQPNADPDNDGLKNWEEEIYKTDKRKADTDGDGYTDGEEVLSGYDPTIPAPNDALEGTDTTVPRAIPNNLTSYLSKIITEKVASGDIKPIKDIKTAPDSVLMNNEDIVNETLIKIKEKADTYFVLSSMENVELNILKNKTTKDDVSQYIAKMSLVLSSDDALTDIKISETEILKDVVENENYENIDKLIAYYKTSLDELEKIDVPNDFVGIHREQMAIFKLTLDILESIRNFKTDPATAAAATEAYGRLGKILEDFSVKLTKKVRFYADK